MEKRYDDKGRELIRECCNCHKYLEEEGQELLQDIDHQMDNDEKILLNIGVLTSSVCKKCEEVLYPEWCHES